MTNQIVFLAPRGFGTEETEKNVIRRLDLYLDQTKRILNESVDLYLFLPKNSGIYDTGIVGAGSINIIRIGGPTRNFLLFAKRSRVFANVHHIRPRLIISSDVRFAFLSTTIFKFGMKNAKIQVQIHGNYDSLKPKFMFLRPFLFLYYFLVFSFSDSIRMASPHQFESFPKTLQSKVKNTVIAPVPFIFETVTRPSEGHFTSIGYVGRIHGERGIERWVEVARNIESKIGKVDYVIIGDGDQRNDFLEALHLNGRSNLKYMGWLSSFDLNQSWHLIGVLLVTAESESFGVAMREALLHGVYVVAFENQATMRLKKEFPKFVFTSRSNKELAELAIKLRNRRIPFKDIQEIYYFFAKEQNISVKEIASSWAQELQSQ